MREFALPAARLGIAAALLVAACGNLPVADYSSADGLPERVELSGVPFHPQEDDQCGPAALATVLEHAGKKRSPEELKNEVYLPGRQGSLQAELLAATRRSGLLPYVPAAKAEALIGELAAGRPVLVLQDVGLPFVPNWHYAVAVGYDRPGRTITLRSGREARRVMDFAAFDRSWAKSGRWAMLALPPEQLPAEADEARFVAAAVDLEAVAPEAAGRAYGSALQRWPDNLLARLGLGNVAYRRHDLAGAEAAYRQATRDHPEAAVAWNNLAQALHEAGRRTEALSAARRAVRLGGPWRARHAATLEAIENTACREQEKECP